MKDIECLIGGILAICAGLFVFIIGVYNFGQNESWIFIVGGIICIVIGFYLIRLRVEKKK